MECAHVEPAIVDGPAPQPPHVVLHVIHLAYEDGARRHRKMAAIVIGHVDRPSEDEWVVLRKFEGELALVSLHKTKHLLAAPALFEVGPRIAAFRQHPVIQGQKEHRMAADLGKVLRLVHPGSQTIVGSTPRAPGRGVMPANRTDEVPAAGEIPLVREDVATVRLPRLAAVQRRRKVGELGHP